MSDEIYATRDSMFLTRKNRGVIAQPSVLIATGPFRESRVASYMRYAVVEKPEKIIVDKLLRRSAPASAVEKNLQSYPLKINEAGC